MSGNYVDAVINETVVCLMREFPTNRQTYPRQATHSQVQVNFRTNSSHNILWCCIEHLKFFSFARYQKKLLILSQDKTSKILKRFRWFYCPNCLFNKTSMTSFETSLTRGRLKVKIPFINRYIYLIKGSDIRLVMFC